tara:strand:- start:284 stop:571 length:288 start_codon:yes stop_codon:yes gene_type:complete
MGIYQQRVEKPREFFDKLIRFHKESMSLKMMEVGTYQLTEADQGGKREEPQGILNLTTRQTVLSVAVMLFEKYGYYNAWGYLQYRKYHAQVDYTI